MTRDMSVCIYSLVAFILENVKLVERSTTIFLVDHGINDKTGVQTIFPSRQKP